ncbi:MAG TPA: SDR family NAD(P)-dependent oxidoreductase, partial [Myxococcota bacterium]|nr:SDR family NAD(P)-dependent oxidoreductase [Myxococcota bacterium]
MSAARQPVGDAPQGHVALVTGGAGAIGAAVCAALAAQGRRVAAADLDRARAAAVAEPLGGAGVAMDVADPESVARAIDEVRARLGPPTVLVSCAGWDRMLPFLETDEPFQARVLEINLAGPIRVTRAVLPDMIAAGFGRIVLVSSDAA